MAGKLGIAVVVIAVAGTDDRMMHKIWHTKDMSSKNSEPVGGLCLPFLIHK